MQTCPVSFPGDKSANLNSHEEVIPILYCAQPLAHAYAHHDGSRTRPPAQSRVHRPQGCSGEGEWSAGCFAHPPVETIALIDEVKDAHAYLNRSDALGFMLDTIREHPAMRKEFGL